MERLSNFRDMGGLVTKTGAQVKKGLLFRCGALADATENDLQALAALNLQTVIDYRDDIEAEKQPSPLLKEVEMIRIAARKNSGDAMKSMSMEQLFANKDLLAHISPELFAQFYAELPFDNEVYRVLIDKVATKQVPLLHHCSAGKDRTGVGAALIYLLLDVSEETIMEEYLLTNAYIEAHPPRWYQYAVKHLGDHPTLKTLAGCDPLFLSSVFEAIKKRYGTYEAYFLAEHQLDREKIANIRAFYTEATVRVSLS